MSGFARALALAALLAMTAAAPGAGAPRSLALGAVAASDVYGAEAARDILKAGGNAVDAAAATAFAEAVTYPEAANIGGGGFMTLFFRGKGYFLDYRETAPRAATRDMYLDAKGDVVPDLSLVGDKAVGVPGTVRGLYEAHRRFGRLSWAEDLAPAIRLASQGFIPSRAMVAVRDGDAPRFAGKTNFARYFGGLRAGRRFRQPQLAATLRRIADLGDKGFYEGRIARLIVAQMGRGTPKGLITLADLEAYRAARSRRRRTSRSWIAGATPSPTPSP